MRSWCFNQGIGDYTTGKYFFLIYSNNKLRLNTFEITYNAAKEKM